jgi:hypothetical protein
MYCIVKNCSDQVSPVWRLPASHCGRNSNPCTHHHVQLEQNVLPLGVQYSMYNRSSAIASHVAVQLVHNDPAIRNPK